jgi:ribokinase
MGKVTVIGSYIVAQVIDSERIPLEGETLTGGNYHVTHGGKGSNMACCASRLGADTTFFGKVGRDTAGDNFVELLRQERVSTKAVLHSDGLPTAVGFIICSRNGSNAILIDIGANGSFTPDDLIARREAIDGADVTLSPLEIPLETALAGARMAAMQGKRAILNPAPACDLRGCDLSAVFVLTPNETEARLCLGLAPDDKRDPAELGEALLKLGAQNVVITLGGRGALWVWPDGLGEFPAVPVAVVDTVGAGDAFNAGLAVGLSEGLPLPEAIRMGVVAGSLSTTRRETIDSYPYRDEVDRHLQKLARCQGTFDSHVALETA